MSDTFDHMADAFDDVLSGRSADEGYGAPWTMRPVCRRCHASDLRWGIRNGHWWLHERNMRPHVCPQEFSNETHVRPTKKESH